MTERRVIAGLRLGKDRPREDPRTLRLARYLDVAAVAGLPQYPASYDLSPAVSDWPMYLNDRLGDCAIAGPAHMVEGWTANVAAILAAVGKPGAPVRLTDADVQAAYSAVGGYRPGDPSTDNGCNMLDVLNYWRTTGLGGRKIQAYAAVDLHNHAEVKAALWLFGGLYLGLGLPVSAQAQVGKRWTEPASKRGNGAPYSWGGHAVNLVAHNRAGTTAVTWGAKQPMTWGFLDAYADEGYVVFSPGDWLTPDGKSPAGFASAALLADLRRVTADGH